VSRGSYDEALKDYTAAIELEESAAAERTTVGASAVAGGELSGETLPRAAAAALSGASAIAMGRPDRGAGSGVGSSAAAYNNRGYVWRKLERFEEAVADYTSSLAVEPGSVRTLNNRAYCAARLGRFAEAIQDYSAVRGRPHERANVRGVSRFVFFF
jgi:tetratricopeptide (TPR) repeat protein